MSKLSIETIIKDSLETLKSKVDYADIRFHELDKSESLGTLNGDIEDYHTSEKSGIGIRVLSHGTWGFSSTESLTSKSIELAYLKAIEQAKAASKFIQSPVKLIPKKSHQSIYRSPVSTNPFHIPLSQKLEHLLQVDHDLTHSKFNYRGVNAAFYERHILYFDTEGSEIRKELLEIEASFYAMAEDKDGHQQKRSYQLPVNHLGTVGWENLINTNLFGHAPRIKEELLQILGAPICKEEKTHLILLPEMMALQTHETIGHALELDRILGYELSYAGGSHVDLDDFGHLKFGSSKLTARADGTIANSPGSTGYDDDGVEGKDITLIQNGVLKNAITSRQMVVEANEKANKQIFQESGGANRAQSYDQLPIERMNNINIDAGLDGDLENIIKDTENGVIMETPRSWSIGSNREHFHFACEIAWEIKDGKKKNVLRNPTYHGHSLPFWKSLDKVGNDKTWQLQQVYNCGKGQPNQIMRLAHGIPACRFANVEVGNK